MLNENCVLLYNSVIVNISCVYVYCLLCIVCLRYSLSLSVLVLTILFVIEVPLSFWVRRFVIRFGKWRLAVYAWRSFG